MDLCEYPQGDQSTIVIVFRIS